MSLEITNGGTPSTLDVDGSTASNLPASGKVIEERSELGRLLATARAWRGVPMAIATVLHTWGSAPRPVGSHMLITEDGRFEGSVSGGCVEAAVMALGIETIGDGRFRRARYGIADGTAWEVGLPCGGEIEILVQRVGPRGFPESLFEDIADARARRRGLSISTDLESGVSEVGEAPGDSAFVVRHAPPRRALIVGAVEIARFLSPMLAQIDVRPIVIDPRLAFLTSERFPDVELDDRWPDDAVRAYAPDETTAVITLSHDPKIDDPALAEALSTSTGYVAALGSRRSHAARLDRLGALGIPAVDLARIEGPAGVAIGAMGPAEIAVSITAGIVRAFRGRAPSPGI